MQLPSRLIFRVHNLQDRDFRKRMAQQRSEVVREVAEGVVSAFEPVNEDKKQCLLHPELFSCMLEVEQLLGVWRYA